MDKKYNVGIVPGSFDPITNGHLDIIRRAAELCERVYVAVMINAEKRYMFDIEERARIAEAAVNGIENALVISSEGMLFELSRALCAEVIIKGVRNETDRAYELEMAEYNCARCSAKTLLLAADRTLSDISSTAVREKIRRSESLDGFLPSSAIEEIQKILNKKENLQ